MKSGDLKGLRIPIFDSFTINKDGSVKSSLSKNQDRYMVINDIENVDDPNESNWRVHKYFQKAFCQILGILIGLFFKLFNYI